MTDLCIMLNAEPGHCHWCGKKLTGRKTRWCSRTCDREFTANHRWTQAKAAAKRLVTFFQCAECKGFFRKVEVNHKVPCRGKHGQWGCWHHQDNLEVLCKPCHKAKTDAQRAQGWT